MYLIGRNRVPEHLRKKHIGIRLPAWMVHKLKENGSPSQQIEKALVPYLKNEKEEEEKG